MADLEVLIDVTKYIQKVGHSAPFSNIVVAENAPGPTVTTDEEFAGYVYAQISSICHHTDVLAFRFVQLVFSVSRSQPNIQRYPADVYALCRTVTISSVSPNLSAYLPACELTFSHRHRSHGTPCKGR